MTLPKHITDRIEKEAEEKYPFVWPKNKHGEDMVQRVGQPPPFSRKWKNSLKMYIDGATTEATRAHELVKALEKIKGKIEQDFIKNGDNELTTIIHMEIGIALNNYQKQKS